MTAALFIGFVGMMSAVVIALIARYLNLRTAFRLLAALSLWFIYAGLLGYFGVIKNTATRPPGIVFLMGPVVLFLVFLTMFVARSTAGERLAMRRRTQSQRALHRRRERSEERELQIVSQRSNVKPAVGFTLPSAGLSPAP